jgi:signal transduction histidine kinase
LFTRHTERGVTTEEWSIVSTDPGATIVGVEMGTVMGRWQAPEPAQPYWRSEDGGRLTFGELVEGLSGSVRGGGPSQATPKRSARWLARPPQAKTGIDELRELAAGLHPSLLTTRGLLAAVEALADRMPIPVEPLDIFTDRFPAAIEASIYFLVSEALTNVVKHARATRAGVRIAAASGRLTVEVSDDGAGSADVHSPGHGLAGLADRVAALDGEFSVRSEPSAGMTLRAEVPLPESEVSA